MYDNLPVDQRVCDFCNLGELDDEIHFLLKCKFHETERIDLLSSLPRYRQLVDNSISHTFIDMMTIKDAETIYKLAQFIKKCFQQRAEYIKSHDQLP